MAIFSTLIFLALIYYSVQLFTKLYRLVIVMTANYEIDLENKLAVRDASEQSEPKATLQLPDTENYHSSVKEMWSAYIDQNLEYKTVDYEAYHFCNNEKDANELAQLVVEGTKRATASLHRTYELDKEDVPTLNEHCIITDYAGIAKCVIKNTRVRIIPFNGVSEKFALREGEGDKSLEYWREAHIKFFNEEATEYGFEFNEDLLVVLEEFEVVFDRVTSF